MISRCYIIGIDNEGNGTIYQLTAMIENKSGGKYSSEKNHVKEVEIDIYPNLNDVIHRLKSIIIPAVRYWGKEKEKTGAQGPLGVHFHIRHTDNSDVEENIQGTSMDLAFTFLLLSFLVYGKKNKESPPVHEYPVCISGTIDLSGKIIPVADMEKKIEMLKEVRESAPQLNTIQFIIPAGNYKNISQSSKKTWIRPVQQLDDLLPIVELYSRKENGISFLKKTAVYLKKNLKYILFILVIAAAGFLAFTFFKNFFMVDKNPCQNLVESIKTGDKAKIENLIDLCTDINQIDDEGNSPLDYAINKNETDITGMLISTGARVNTEKYKRNPKAVQLIRQAAEKGIMSPEKTIELDEFINHWGVYWEKRQYPAFRMLSVDAPALSGKSLLLSNLGGNIIDNNHYEINESIIPASAMGTKNYISIGIQLNGNEEGAPYNVCLDNISLECVH